MLIDFNTNDLESWKKRKRVALVAELQEEIMKRMEEDAKLEQDKDEDGKDLPTPVISNEQLMAKVNPRADALLQEAEAAYKRSIVNKPGAVPHSVVDLGVGDTEGNQLYMVTVIREDANDYIKVLKKNQYAAQQFDYDLKAHN